MHPILISKCMGKAKPKLLPRDKRKKSKTGTLRGPCRHSQQTVTWGFTFQFTYGLQLLSSDTKSSVFQWWAENMIAYQSCCENKLTALFS